MYIYRKCHNHSIQEVFLIVNDVEFDQTVPLCLINMKTINTENKVAQK